MTKEQKFYSILQDLFVGAKLEGDSGYVNLMNIKTDYFNNIRERIKKEVEAKFKGSEPEDLFDRLYTFFDSYFSDGGAIFFSSTPVYKNIYTKVYSDREDTALFWKTSKLYYVKSEANYKSIKNLSINSDPEVAFDFDFDASLLKHKQTNEKKELEFYFIGTQRRKDKKIIKFRVLYKNDNKYSKLEEILKIKGKDKIIKYLLGNIKTLKNPKITVSNEGLEYAKLSDKGARDKAEVEFIISENKDLHDSVAIESAISKIGEIEKYLRLKGIVLGEDEIGKAFKIYKKQTEIDYFIHRDAKSFLREQFDLYMYQHLANNLDTVFDQEALDREKKIKEIAYLAIEFIGNFEDELKKIWLKPKFARNSNYVVTLDLVARKKNGIQVIKEIIKHKGIDAQIAEWHELGIVDKKFDKKMIVKDGKLNKDFQCLPIDTKYFKNLEIIILELFDNLDEELDGRLIKSENFQALNTLLPKYKDQVQTIYIDPPFNTGEDFYYYDRFQDSTWLTLMSNRIDLSRDMLKNNGNYFLHLDRNANYYGRYILEKCFSSISEIVRDTNATNDPEAKTVGMKDFASEEFITQHDTIFRCSKESNYKFFKLWKPNRRISNLGLGQLDILSIPNDTKSKGMSGRTYYYEKYSSEGKLKQEFIDYTKLNETIYPIGDIWTDLFSFTQTELRVSENISYDTQKPEHLLRRIIQATTEKNDIIMDFFLGSGTTVAVAHKLNRKWLGIEMGGCFENFYYACKDIEKTDIDKYEIAEVIKENENKIKAMVKCLGLLGRMKIVLSGDKNFMDVKRVRRSGLSRSINWNGGGFFKYYKLEQYEDALKRAAYNPTEKKLENIDFSFSEKQAALGFEVDLKKEKARFVFEKLYPDVDFAETISNLFGKKIKKISKDKVVFEGDFEVDLNKLDFEKYKSFKDLIYW